VAAASPTQASVVGPAVAWRAGASNRSSSGIRLRALIGVMYGSGLRLSEALALRGHDVDGKAGTVRVRHGKCDKSRVVGIDPHAWLCWMRGWSAGAHSDSTAGT
jgi:site-specific recombinase XerD